MKSVIFDHLNRKPHLTFQLSKNLHQVAKLSNAALTNEQVKLEEIQVLSTYNQST